jgi:hypothetical protein
MNWEDALEIVVRQTKHERFRWLCSDENTDAKLRDGYRQHVIDRATNVLVDQSLVEAGDQSETPPVPPCGSC